MDGGMAMGIVTMKKLRAGKLVRIRLMSII